MESTRRSFSLQGNDFFNQTTNAEMQIEEDSSEAARIGRSSQALKRKNTENEMSSVGKNRRITTTSKKRKQASLAASLDRSNDEVDEKRRKTMEGMGVSSGLFKDIESYKIPELEEKILVHINYAIQHNTVKKLTQKTFEYPQANGQSSLYFQIFYAGENEFLETLRLKLVELPQDPEKVIRLAPVIHGEENFESVSKQVEKLLLENFEVIANEVKKQGYWKLPPQLQQQIPSLFLKICGFTQSSAKKQVEVVEQNKALFSDDADLLDRFCTLKIKEIVSCIKKEGKPPCSSVWLSILREQEGEVDITEVEIFFEEGLAVMPLLLSKKKFPSLLEALFSSSWMDKESDRTIIRFSDHQLEDNLAIKKYCKEIEYGLLSSQIRHKEMGKLNFWEDLAFNWKKRAKSDFSQIETVKRILNKSRSSAQVDLAPEIQELALREKNNQADNVRFILRNQRSGIGTLLYLPTGFGKTFIIFMAVAQHIKSIEKENKKPYLVIVPAVNVRQTWIDNHSQLTNGSGANADSIFSEASSIVTFDTTKKFLAAYEKPEFRNHNFVVITIDLLRPIVNHLLSVKTSDLSETNGSLLRCLGILSQDNFILGDRSFWEERIRALNSWNYQTEVLELLKTVLKNEHWCKEGLQDVFYPTDSKNNLEEAKLVKKRKAFISGFEAVCKQNANIVSHFPDNFLAKISFFNEEGARCIDSKKLFDYCHCFFFFSQSQKKDALLKDLWSKLSPILVAMSEEQKKLLEKYDAFKSSFNGLILDESDQILVTKSDKVSEQTDILLDIAKTFQTRSEKDNPQNPLLIASSATPWPNSMNELKLHLKILLPKLLGQFRDLHDDLFGKWNSFEASLDKVDTFKSSKMSGDQADEKPPSSKRSPEETINSLADSLNTVQTHFYQWIRLLFEETVSYEKPTPGQTNNSTEEILYVSCDKSNRVGTDEEILSLIRTFYSGLLTNPKASGQQGDMLRQIFEHLNGKDHFAFFVDLQNDAAYLAMEISKYYQDKFGEDVQIGLFYNEAFVKNQDEIEKKYTNVTFNTDRMVNINSFNNIFRFEDFYKYLDQYFGTLNINKMKSAIAPLVSVIRCIRKNEKLREVVRRVDKKNPLVNMRKLIEEKYRKNENPASSLPEKEHEIYKIFDQLIVLEKKSKSEIIKDFSEELKIFKQFMDKNLQEMETAAAFKTYSTQAMEKIKGRVKTKKPEDPIKDLKRTIFHYLNKIYQSKILIFGNAGTSGMRIDADRLTLLSGAWTEGKLGQIKGRVGRQKGKIRDSRPCKIYLPITSTLFEFFILRYYIKKALYDLFITSKEFIGAEALCQHLILSGSLIAYYKRCNSEGGEGDSFLDPSIHQNIKERITQSQEYLTLGAYEKALAIIPPEIHKEMEKFKQEVFLGVSRKLHPIQPERSGLSVEELMPDVSELDVESLEEESAGKLDVLISNVVAIKLNSSNKPKHPPRINPAPDAAWSVEELERVKEQVFQSGKEKVIIFLVPTRGEQPDIPLQKFTRHISESVEANCYPIVIYGVNHREGEERKIEGPLSSSSSLFAKIAAFTWFEEDRRDKVPPIGQMRNFCLEQAKRVWQALTEGDAPIKVKEAIYLVSMDGDTKLTTGSFQQLMKKVNHQSSRPYVVATGGYDFASGAPEWSKRSNRISMRINSACQTEVKPLNTYYGYLAEPLTAISPSVVQGLFEQECKSSFFQMKNEETAPFGFWNFEGRRLQRYLHKLTGEKLNSFGPPSDEQERPILKNYDRFIIEAPPFLLKRQPLSKENLAAVITRLFCQSQHSIKPYFMASNISYHHEQAFGPVHRFAAYFYAKNVLNLLNLGPHRGIVLTQKISDFYHKKPLKYSEKECKKFGVGREEFISFLERNFGERQADLAAEEPSQKVYNFKKYAFLLAYWARNVFIVLGEEFGMTYSGEFDSQGRYTPMAMPENYPSKAVSGLEEDEEEDGAEDKDPMIDYVSPKSLVISSENNKTISESANIPKNGDEQLRNQSMSSLAAVSFADIEQNLAKKHRLTHVDMHDSAGKEMLERYPEIQKIVFIAKHSLYVLLLKQVSQNLNDQKRLCQQTLEKVKEAYESQHELAISLHHSDKGDVVHFAQLQEDSLSYTSRWENENGLKFEEGDFKVRANSLNSFRQGNFSSINDSNFMPSFVDEKLKKLSKGEIDSSLLPFFEGKVENFSDKEIAQQLWLNPGTLISDGMVEKVNLVAVYLKDQGFKLMGIKADGDCFCNAFLESYKTLSRKIPILESQKNKIAYLRGMIAALFETTSSGIEKPERIQEITKGGEWLIAAGEGDLLAQALDIPIRVITVNQDLEGCGISDMLTFREKDKDAQEWSTINESEKPKEYILIVDLGGHFVYAQPLQY